ncbi:MAG TPA: hypothetical protein VLL52_18625 [Anaerolineae bacterium]|nr:hypothetical protein [Anaerolineae bacterium]
MNDYPEDPLIRASEIGEYVYCHRAWWLKRFEGRQSSYVRELRAGQEYHEAHGALVRRSQRTRQIAIGLFMVAIIILGLWLLQTL